MPDKPPGNQITRIRAGHKRRSIHASSDSSRRQSPKRGSHRIEPPARLPLTVRKTKCNLIPMVNGQTVFRVKPRHQRVMPEPEIFAAAGSDLRYSFSNTHNRQEPRLL